VRTLLAVIRDTLLALRRRRLFWLHLWLSVLAVVMYAGISCHETGWSVLYGMKEMENPWLRQSTPWEHTLHCWTLARIIRWWVAGGAVFVVLFSTSALMPETLERGSAELLVPRARGRGLLLAGRFAGSLIYVLLHTTLVVTGLFLALGLRLGIWHYDLWMAIPVVTVIFAPMQAVSMLMGVLTRSGTAALLVALLFAGTVWAFQESASAPETPSAAVVDDKDGNPQNEAPARAPNPNGNGNGDSDTIGSEIVRFAAAVLPPARDSFLWLERYACPRPQAGYTYRDLFHRLRYGHRGLGAIVARAIAAASDRDAEEKKQEDAVVFTELLISAGVFTIAVMLLAAWLLKRRDL
jgi:hypothetical protein